MAFANLQTDSSIQGESDVIGGNYILDSGLYKMNIEVAYMGESSGGAMSLNLQLKDANEKRLNTTVYLTSGRAKGSKNTYTDRDGKPQYLPGFMLGNSLSLLTVGKEIGSLDTEEKVINLYNYEQKKELPTKVNMLTELLNKEIIAGVIKEIVDKNVKNAEGNYVPSGETRENNEISKVFRAKDGLTVPEIKAEVKESAFMDQWDKRFTGTVKDRSSGKSANGSVTGAPATSKPTKSLFNN